MKLKLEILYVSRKLRNIDHAMVHIFAKLNIQPFRRNKSVEYSYSSCKPVHPDLTFYQVNKKAAYSLEYSSAGQHLISIRSLASGFQNEKTGFFFQIYYFFLNPEQYFQERDIEQWDSSLTIQRAFGRLIQFMAQFGGKSKSSTSCVVSMILFA